MKPLRHIHLVLAQDRDVAGENFLKTLKATVKSLEKVVQELDRAGNVMDLTKIEQSLGKIDQEVFVLRSEMEGLE